MKIHTVRPRFRHELAIVQILMFASVAVFAQSNTAFVRADPLERKQQPQRLGTVESLPPSRSIVAQGRSAVIAGDVERARQEALVNAYRSAVNRGVGVEIGELFVMRNFQEFNDVIVKRSTGYVRSYEMLSEGVTEAGDEYEVIIEAEVAEGNMEERADEIGLQLYVQILGSPTVLILLDSNPASEYFAREFQPVTAGAIELEIARVLHRAGYRVLTADDVGAFDPDRTALEQDLFDARRGSAAKAREIGAYAEADLVLMGFVEDHNENAITYGPQTSLVTSGVKTIVTASGDLIDVETYRIEREARSYSSARSLAIRDLGTAIGEDLRWRLPEILAGASIEIDAVILGAARSEADAWAAELASLPGVEEARQRTPTGSGPSGLSFTVATTFLGTTVERLLSHLRTKYGTRIELVEKSKHRLVVLLEEPTSEATSP